MRINFTIMYPNFKEMKSSEFFDIIESLINETCVEPDESTREESEFLGVSFSCLSKYEAYAFVNAFFTMRENPFTEQQIDLEYVHIHCDNSEVNTFYQQLCVHNVQHRLSNVETVVMAVNEKVKHLEQEIQKVEAINQYTGLYDFSKIINAITDEMERHGMDVRDEIGKAMSHRSH